MKKSWFKRKRSCFFLFCLLSFGVFHFFPLPDALEKRPVSKVLLAQDGNLLAARIAADQQWRFPRNRQIPAKYAIAVTEFEDRYFYYHPGFNPLAIARAFRSNMKAGRVVSGGSTISMQLARLLRKDPPRTYKNKIIEILLAMKLEWHFTKDEILSMYASQAPFGGNTVGIGAACWRYFGRYLTDIDDSPDKPSSRINTQNKVSQLSWAEAALLAVLPNSPALIHPGRSREKLKRKRDRLLTHLYDKGYLDKNEYELSLLESLPHKPNPLPRLAPHLLGTLIERYPDHDLFVSTIDSTLQKGINDIALMQCRELTEEGVHNLSIIVINNRDMTTTAYIGNVTTAQNKHLYGDSIDIAVKPRSTGSILKPLLYGLMLQSGDILPKTLVADVPTNFKGFTPENYDHKYRGAVPAKEALSRSLNIPAVRMLRKYGVAKFHEDLKQLGMTTLFRSADEYGLSLILGGAEGSLWEITKIYAQLVNTARDGWDSTQTPVSLLNNQLPQAPTKNIISQGSAWLTLEALLEVVRPDTESFWKEFSSSQQIAWKTGTSYGLRDAWAIGSNGNYTVGVWAGNAGGEGIPGLSGLNTAAPALFQVFDFLGNSRWLEKPEFALKEVQTCKDDGYLAAGQCDFETILAPQESHFQEVTPYHKKIQLDLSGQYRVHGGCESVADMITKNQLILPPIQEYYWRQNHGEYISMPPWREDCIPGLANYADEMPMDIIYPLEGTKVYIPLELDGKKGRVVFRASHRDKAATIFWHVDNRHIEKTTVFHDIELDLNPGWHKLILVDELGFRLERWFKILEKQSPTIH